MEPKAPAIVLYILRSAIAVTIVLAALPTIDAQGPGDSGSVEAQDRVGAAMSEPGTFFVHTATGANISANSTFIDHPLINNNPNAIVLVTQNLNPGGTGGGLNPYAIGVWYSSSRQKWAIFNQDLAAMNVGVAFNVLIPVGGANVFVHTAAVPNIITNSTFIDHSLTNGNPDAIMLVTQNWNPGGGAGTYNDHVLGVWYSSAAQKWAVFNQDTGSMPPNASFNVLIPPAGANVFVHTATAANSSVLWTYIDHPLTNNNPNALVFFTQNWNPGGGAGTYFNFPLGVWYSSSEQKWTVHNQSVIGISEGADFNVVVLAHKLHLPLVLK